MHHLQRHSQGGVVIRLQVIPLTEAIGKCFDSLRFLCGHLKADNKGAQLDTSARCFLGNQLRRLKLAGVLPTGNYHQRTGAAFGRGKIPNRGHNRLRQRRIGRRAWPSHDALQFGHNTLLVGLPQGDQQAGIKTGAGIITGPKKA